MSILEQRWLQDLRRLEPTWEARVRGATQTEISRLEAVSGGELPEDYLEFLIIAGADPGGLQIYGDATTRIGDLLEHYQDVANGDAFEPPPGFVLIACRGSGVDEAGVRFAPVQERGVHELSGDAICGQLAASLPGLIGRAAFFQYQVPKWGHQRLVRSQSEVENRVPDGEFSASWARAASDYGLEETWYSDHVVRVFEKGELALVCYAHQSGPFVYQGFAPAQAHVVGANTNDVSTLANHLATLAGAAVASG